jgi:Tfp pilus assembly protein PilF
VTGAELKAADDLLSRDPASPKARLVRSKLYFRAGRLAEAKAGLKSLLLENDLDNQARYGLASIYEKEGDKKMAREMWERFLQIEPGSAIAAQRLRALQ